MKRYLLILLLLLSAALTSSPATSQEIEPPVLIGIGKVEKRTEELSHLYAVDARIVDRAAKIGTSDLARAFVSATARTDCCDPKQVATNCFYCCDSHVLCTDNARYSSLLSESTKVSDAEWKSIQTRGLDSIKGWPEVNKLLEISPPIEVSRDDPKFGAFVKMMTQK